MKNKTDSQTTILSAIKKLGISLRSEIRMGDKLLRREMLKIEERVGNIEEKQKVMDKKLDSLDSKLDGFVGKVETLEKENEIGTEHYRDHEKRISKLETTIQPA